MRGGGEGCGVGGGRNSHTINIYNFTRTEALCLQQQVKVIIKQLQRGHAMTGILDTCKAILGRGQLG